MGIELEYKYSASPQVLEAVATQFGPFQTIQMHTLYYDTPSRSLSAAHCTLRLRQENGVSICTLKTPLPDGSREEWECRADTIAEGIARLPQAQSMLSEPVEVVCGARFTRLACRTATAEIALDQGVLLGGGREIPLWELEVEHKSGDEAATLSLAQSLADQYSLKAEPKSKFARAIALAEGAQND